MKARRTPKLAVLAATHEFQAPKSSRQWAAEIAELPTREGRVAALAAVPVEWRGIVRTHAPVVPKEQNIQAAAIQALLLLPGVQGVLRINGGFVGHGTSKRPSYRLFRRGDPIVSTGFPDLLVFVRGRAPVMIEMKRPNTLTNVSEAQDGVLKWADRVGMHTLVAASWEAVGEAVKGFISGETM